MFARMSIRCNHLTALIELNRLFFSLAFFRLCMMINQTARSNEGQHKSGVSLFYATNKCWNDRIESRAFYKNRIWFEDLTCFIIINTNTNAWSFFFSFLFHLNIFIKWLLHKEPLASPFAVSLLKPKWREVEEEEEDKFVWPK